MRLTHSFKKAKSSCSWIKVTEKASVVGIGQLRIQDGREKDGEEGEDVVQEYGEPVSQETSDHCSHEEPRELDLPQSLHNRYAKVGQGEVQQRYLWRVPNLPQLQTDKRKKKVDPDCLMIKLFDNKYSIINYLLDI